MKLKQRGCAMTNDNQNFNTASATQTKDEWLTPPDLIAALGEFDLDPCAPTPETRPWNMAKHHYSILDNGLNRDWVGRVWLNPPYGRETFKWLERLAEHKQGIALIFARTETKGVHAQIWQKAHAVFFFEGRLSFYHVDGTKGNCANAPSCLVSYSEKDTDAIFWAREAGKIKGRLVVLGGYDD